MELDPFFAVTDTVDTPANNNAGSSIDNTIDNTNTLKSESNHGSTNDNNTSTTTINTIDSTKTETTKNDDNITSSENTTLEQQIKQPNTNNHILPKAPTSIPITKINEHQQQQQQIKISENDPEQIILNLLMQDSINENECTILRKMNNENNTLKGKISKLKNLLSRSAKAHKDATSELSTSKSKLQTAEYTISILQDKIEMLYKRPSHLDLLADFETNFDRALLSLGEKEGEQSGGEDPSSSSSSTKQKQQEQAYSSMLQQRKGGGLGNVNDNENDLDEDREQQQQVDIDDQETLITNLRTRMEELEVHNTHLLQRITKLEQSNATLTEERDIAKSKISTLELNVRLSKLETTKAIQALKDKTIGLTEMQFEIDLVTKSSLDAISKSNATLEAAKDIRVSKRHCEELQAKVDALQEWALASTEAKRLVLERAHDLENKLKTLELSHKESIDQLENTSPSSTANNTNSSTTTSSSSERRLWSKSSSKVIGAGMAITHPLTLGDDIVLADTEVVVLRWKFDVTPMDMEIDFAIYKGNITDSSNTTDKGKYTSGPEYLVEPRYVC